jgi:vesicle transport protein SEC22
LKKIKSEYLDTSSNTYIEKLNKEILDVHSIMNENINLILDREKSLDSINNLANTVKQDSETFKRKAIETRMRLLLAKYSILIAIAAIVLLVIIFKIYI